MKKTLILMICTALCTTAISAQSKIGLKAGVSMTNFEIDKDEVDVSNTKAGFLIGLTSHNDLGLVYFESDLLYHRKGAEYELGSTKVDVNLNYLELPVSFGVSILATPLHVYGGGYVSYLLKANYDYMDESGNTIATFDNKEAFNNFDLGLHAGLSLQLNKLIIDARVARGLSEIESDDIVTSTSTYTQNDLRNFTLQLSASVLF